MPFATWRRRVSVGVLIVGSLAFLAGCGSSSETGATGKPLVKETKAEGEIGSVTPPPASPAGVRPDPDSANMGGQDVNTVVEEIANDRYQLVIQNTSRVGYIDAVDWVPPSGATIESVAGSSVGTCSLSNNEIACDGLHLDPPKCLCRPGGSATITFVMHQLAPGKSDTPVTLGIAGSGLEIRAMTPILGNIPSTQGSSAQNDT